ncbi:major facilitator superfamily domain-containing protein [Abortiporus biennis]|nr:major facilitator superfamily domain-containing protein [Abortiporus biennis]
MYPSPSPQPPPLFSAVRIASLLTSLLVALGSGTNYVFSAYGPQLASRLHLSHTQMNIIGLSGNIGVYGTAPLWGKLVDAKGPRILLVMGFVTLLSGYAGIRQFYEDGLPQGATKLPTFSIVVLSLCGLLTGMGGNGGLVSAMNATAKSWPDKARASTTGLVLSGFGLSAFLFSTIAHVFFPGDTSSFLLILAIGTSLPMVLGFFFIKPVPLPGSDGLEHEHEHGGYEHVANNEVFEEEEEDEYLSVGRQDLMRRESMNNSHTHLLNDHDHTSSYLELSDDEPTSALYHSDDASSINEDVNDPSELGTPLEMEETIPEAISASLDISHSAHRHDTSDYIAPPNYTPTSVALSPTRSTHARHRSRSSISRRHGDSRRHSSAARHGRGINKLPNIWGKKLAVSSDFWVMFSITSLLAGTGLMYINNAGSIAQALYANNNASYDEAVSSQLQALQVSAVSIMNCVGRIAIGLIADFTNHYLHLPRSFCISIVAILFIISQIVVYATSDVESLWKGSSLLGLAYGAMFGLFPTITIEWFGLPHFSENWGFVSLSPMIGGNIFSIAFGKNLDAHSSTASNTTTLISSSTNSTYNLTSTATSSLTSRDGGDLPSAHQCLSGRQCYASSLQMTIVACCLALTLALYAGWKDWKHYKKTRIHSTVRRGSIAVRV